MEYIYAAMILHSAEKDINEENVKSIIDIDEAMETTAMAAAAPAAAAPAAAEAAVEEEEEEEEEEEASEEEAAAGLGALFG